jgi:hypothetical protein
MLPVSTYVIYIAAMPCKVWHALISANQTLCYLGKAVESTWHVGSPIYFRGTGPELYGEVLEYDYPKRIRVALFDTSVEFKDKFPNAHITYELETLKEVVRLTVSQSLLLPSDDNVAPADNLPNLPEWPAVLSSLKTMLETGEAIDITKLSPILQNEVVSSKSY